MHCSVSNYRTPVHSEKLLLKMLLNKTLLLKILRKHFISTSVFVKFQSIFRKIISDFQLGHIELMDGVFFKRKSQSQVLDECLDFDVNFDLF